jgi:hypothetical protein
MLFGAEFILNGITLSSRDLHALKKCEVIFGQALTGETYHLHLEFDRGSRHHSFAPELPLSIQF